MIDPLEPIAPRATTSLRGSTSCERSSRPSRRYGTTAGRSAIAGAGWSPACATADSSWRSSGVLERGSRFCSSAARQGGVRAAARRARITGLLATDSTRRRQPSPSWGIRPTSRPPPCTRTAAPSASPGPASTVRGGRRRGQAARRHRNEDGGAPVLVRVAIDSPFLQGGFVVADTPGLASINPAHRRATLSYLPVRMRCSTSSTRSSRSPKATRRFSGSCAANRVGLHRADQDRPVANERGTAERLAGRGAAHRGAGRAARAWDTGLSALGARVCRKACSPTTTR